MGADFKYVSKAALFMVPFLGWAMFLTGGQAVVTKSGAGGEGVLLPGRWCTNALIATCVIHRGPPLLPQGTSGSSETTVSHSKSA